MPFGEEPILASTRNTTLKFLLNKNLGLRFEEPWAGRLSAAGIEEPRPTDMVRTGGAVADHEPDTAFIPSGDFHRLLAKGDRHHRGLAIAASKFTGGTTMRSSLVVRKDDPATCLEDLAGARYGYINRSCSSTYFPPSILLQREGRAPEKFMDLVPVSPGPRWDGLIDAVTSGTVRASMVLEDVLKTFSEKAQETKVIGEYSGSKGPVVLAREGLDEAATETLMEALLAWFPDWRAVYGGFKPFYLADVRSWFHDLDALPVGVRAARERSRSGETIAERITTMGETESRTGREADTGAERGPRFSDGPYPTRARPPRKRSARTWGSWGCCLRRYRRWTGRPRGPTRDTGRSRSTSPRTSGSSARRGCALTASSSPKPPGTRPRGTRRPPGGRSGLGRHRAVSIAARTGEGSGSGNGS